jgi:formimidoylglutamate deiminase
VKNQTTTNSTSFQPTLLRPSAVLIDGTVKTGLEIEVAEGRISAIRPMTGPENLIGKLVVPGFVNAHSHAFQRGIRGWVQWSSSEDNFWSWRERMYSLANRLDPEGVEAVSALAYLEMLEAGFTSVGEFHYLHHQAGGASWDDKNELAKRVITAGRDVGLRVALLRVAYSRGGAELPPTEEQLRFCDTGPDAVLSAIDDLKRSPLVLDDPCVTVGLAPHSVRAVPDSWLREFAGFDGPIHTHIDEQKAEVEQSLAEYGKRPCHVFAESGLVTSRFTGVHFTWPDASEIALLRSLGGGVCACPTTEMDLGDGFLPIEHLEGVNLSIGTDSHARIDPFAEVRALELHARARLGRRNVLVTSADPNALAARLLEIGSKGGSRALELNGGSIAVGADADLVALSIDGTPTSTGPLLPNIVFASGPQSVRDVWVAGKRVISDGKHPERRAIIERAKAVLT